MELSTLYCDICEHQFETNYRLKRHLTTRKHKGNERRIALMQQNRDDDCRNETERPESADCSVIVSPASIPNESTSPSLRLTQQLNQDSCSGPEALELELEDFTEDDKDTEGYYPFNSRMSALLYIYSNSLRPVSVENLTFVSSMCKDMDPFAPSISTLKEIKLPGYCEPTKFYADKGTEKIPYYVNLPSTIISQCLMNPDIATKLQRYPTELDNDDLIQELFQGRRWNEDSIYFSPMIEIGSHNIFIGEIVMFEQTINGVDTIQGFGKIKKFYKLAPSLEFHADMEYFIVPPPILSPNYYMIVGGGTINCSDILVGKEIPFTRTNTRRMVNKSEFRHLTDQEWEALLSASPFSNSNMPVAMVPLALYSDDTSGNRSKKWNSFDVWALMLAGLPRKENAKLNNIHLICASNSVKALDMAKAIVDDLLALEKGVVMFDSALQKEVLVVAPVLCFLADNARSSELVNHSGSSANKFCRMCEVDKTTIPHQIANERNKQEAQRQMKEIKDQPSEAKKKECRTKYGLKEHYNPLLDLSCDIYQCTPVECLHTLLLGPYKYFTGQLMLRLNSREKAEVIAKLKDTSYSGLPSRLSPTGVCRNFKSFHGRDFKILAQIALHIFWDHFTMPEKEIWKELTKVFYFTYCKLNANCDVENVMKACESFISSLSYFPDLLKNKPKLHALLHLADNIKDFGATSCFNTERCECFNGIVRLYNIHSNKKACSRDIATRFAQFEALNLLCSAAKFPETARCGKAFRNLIQSKTHLQQHLTGISMRELHQEKEIYSPGCLRKKSSMTMFGHMKLSTTRSNLTVLEAKYDQGYQLLSDVGNDDEICLYTAVVGRDGKLINNNDFVTFEMDGEVQYGQLDSSFESLKDKQHHSLVRLYLPVMVQDEVLRNEFDCPILELSSRYVDIIPKCIMSAISIFHECTNTCTYIHTTQMKTVEREEVEELSLAINHDRHNKYYSLNIYCISLHQ